MTVSCIIAAYNESERIAYVLEKLQNIGDIDEIIVVDDGSADKTYEISKNFTKVCAIRLNKNTGKANAIRTGLEYARSKNILLFDADLTYFDTQSLNQGIKTFLLQKDLDCLIFRAEYIKIKITKADLVQTGIRLIRKEILQSIYKQKILGYQLEAAISFYLLDKNKLNYAWMSFSSKQLNKISKRHSIMGLLADLFMNIEIFKYRGFLNYWLMVLKFHPTELTL